MYELTTPHHIHHKVAMHCPTPQLAEIQDRTKISQLIFQRHQADVIWPTWLPTHYYYSQKVPRNEFVQYIRHRKLSK